MGLFSFDEQYPFFDVTPIDNLFIQEYLPTAKGDYVRVYLYGLMHTYHRHEEMTLNAFAKELNLEITDVENAYRYWERRGLVLKTSDNPKSYRYVSAKQVMMTGKIIVDEKYESFALALNNLFGTARKLHGGETQLAFEWIEEMHLPQEVVLLLISHLIDTRGKQFSFKAAQKEAIELAAENVQTREDAIAVLQRKKAVYDGAKKVLRRMGKRRPPSDDELELYGKWLTEYGFQEDAILEACRETVKGDPTFAYLDGILRGVKKRAGESGLPDTKRRMEAVLNKDKQRGDPLRELYRALGLRAAPVTDGTLALYEQMAERSPHQVILLAAGECARSGGKLNDVMQLVTSWQSKGLDTEEKVRDYIALFNAQNAFLQDMYTLWGKKTRPTASDRVALNRWQKEYGFSDEALCFVAPYAEHTDYPIAYMETILKSLHEKGIHDGVLVKAEMTADRRKQQQAKKVAGKAVGHQAYEQRDYHEDDLSELKEMLKENRP